MEDMHLELKPGKTSDYEYTEAVKTLRTNIQFCGSSVRVIMFTSAIPSEGKSDLSFATAEALAQIGKRTLLIDADIRKSILTYRYQLKNKLKAVIDGIALVTNTIPGMVIGIAFMFIFSGTPLQNTFPLIILCNVVHFFSTPYLMMKNSLSKLNNSWETTASLMGDTWFKTLVRVVTPNMISTLLEVFSYYFVNAMVTVSAVIFIAGARTMVITTKIKELQYYTKFNEVFVLSIFILATNLIIKGVLGYFIKKKQKEK